LRMIRDTVDSLTSARRATSRTVTCALRPASRCFCLATGLSPQKPTSCRRSCARSFSARCRLYRSFPGSEENRLCPGGTDGKADHATRRGMPPMPSQRASRHPRHDTAGQRQDGAQVRSGIAHAQGCTADDARSPALPRPPRQPPPRSRSGMVLCCETHDDSVVITSVADLNGPWQGLNFVLESRTIRICGPSVAPARRWATRADRSSRRRHRVAPEMHSQTQGQLGDLNTRFHPTRPDQWRLPHVHP